MYSWQYYSTEYIANWKECGGCIHSGMESTVPIFCIKNLIKLSKETEVYKGLIT
jgi:hypothetical protein